MRFQRATIDVQDNADVPFRTVIDHGLEIERAELVRLENPFPSHEDFGSKEGSKANVAFVRARKPIRD